jgi:hypothetical protein
MEMHYTAAGLRGGEIISLDLGRGSRKRYGVPVREEDGRRERGEAKRKRQSASTIPSLAASAPFSVGEMCSGPAKGHKTKVGVGVRSGGRGEREERNVCGAWEGHGRLYGAQPAAHVLPWREEKKPMGRREKNRLAETRGGEQEEEKREGTRERDGEDTENEGAVGFA